MSYIKIFGGCMCGECRYVATSTPTNSTICHCPDCRKAVGAQSVAWLTFQRNVFSFYQGQPLEYHSSEGVTRTFCPVCGTSLTYTNEDRLAEIDVTIGSVDHPEAFPPREIVFAEHKLPWA